jgi:hypothetical protein
VIHVLGLAFDEEHNGEVRFQISLFLKIYKHLQFPCLAAILDSGRTF